MELFTIVVFGIIFLTLFVWVVKKIGYAFAVLGGLILCWILVKPEDREVRFNAFMDATNRAK